MSLWQPLKLEGCKVSYLKDLYFSIAHYLKRVSCSTFKGKSINYISIYEWGEGSKMLMDAHEGERGIFEMDM